MDKVAKRKTSASVIWPTSSHCPDRFPILFAVNIGIIHVQDSVGSDLAGIILLEQLVDVL